MYGSLGVGLFLNLLLLLSTPLCIAASENDHDGHRMMISESGLVMNNNHHTLPWDCAEISGEHEFVVLAGREYAINVPGMVFGMSQHEYRVNPCSRITVTFVNKDEVRHQWMVHGLPAYLYPTGMFHLEAMAGREVQGTFIVPGDHKTYLVHCDMAQHMEKGMKGQMVVGNGSGNLWSVAGVSDSFRRSDYLPGYTTHLIVLFALVTFVFVFWRLVRAGTQ